MKRMIVYSLLVSSLFTLSGCGRRVVDWVEGCFCQTTAIEESKVPQRYVRTVKSYNQFTTVAIFDGMWLSDAVKTVYSDTWAMKFGKSDERRQAFLRASLKKTAILFHSMY